MLARRDIAEVRTAEGQPTIRPRAVRCRRRAVPQYLNFLNHEFDAHETCTHHGVGVLGTCNAVLVENNCQRSRILFPLAVWIPRPEIAT
jgi:hypothetical protein